MYLLKKKIYIVFIYFIKIALSHSAFIVFLFISCQIRPICGLHPLHNWSFYIHVRLHSFISLMAFSYLVDTGNWFPVPSPNSYFTPYSFPLHTYFFINKNYPCFIKLFSRLRPLCLKLSSIKFSFLVLLFHSFHNSVQPL